MKVKSLEKATHQLWKTNACKSIAGSDILKEVLLLIAGYIVSARNLLLLIPVLARAFIDAISTLWHFDQELVIARFYYFKFQGGPLIDLTLLHNSS